MLSDLKYSLSKSYVAGGMPEVEAVAAADGAVANALGLSEAAGFDACTFDPLAQLWGAQFGTARRLLGATHQLELLGAPRRLEQATALLSAYLALNLQLVTLVSRVAPSNPNPSPSPNPSPNPDPNPDLEPDADPNPHQVSGVASVTGFEGEAAYASSADAVLASVVDQLVAHSAKVASPHPNLALTLNPHPHPHPHPDLNPGPGRNLTLILTPTRWTAAPRPPEISSRSMRSLWSARRRRRPE